MTEEERWTLNREIADGIGFEATRRCSLVCGPESIRHFLDINWWIPDFAGDLNAAWEMGERLREMGRDIFFFYRAVIVRSMKAVTPYDLLQAPAEVRAQAAAEVLRERVQDGKWVCQNPQCRAVYAEYINGCPKCYEGNLNAGQVPLHFSVQWERGAK